MDDLIRSHRRWLKDSIRKTVDWSATGQSRGLPQRSEGPLEAVLDVLLLCHG